MWLKTVFNVVVVVIVLAVSSTSARIIAFDHCGSTITPIGKVVQIDITPCDSDPCVFHVGSNVTAKITFIPGEIVQVGLFQIIAIFARGEQLPWPMKNPLACDNHDLNCPLKPNAAVTAVVQTRILAIPGRQYKVVGQVFMTEMGLKNYVFCFRISVQVKF
jgi:Niemann-Pick C2 protein